MQKTLLVKLVEEYYGAGKSERVYGRLAEEMRLVGRSTWMPLWRCVAALRQEFGPENVLVLGSTNDSLLACLLGATSVNPLPPHYRCTNCHYTTFGRDRYADGRLNVWPFLIAQTAFSRDRHADSRDTPDAVCPACGGSMEGDGHRLSSRSLAMRLPDIGLRVPDEMRQLVTDFIPDYWQRMDENGIFTVEPYSDEELTALRLVQSDGQQGIIEIGALRDDAPALEGLPPLMTTYHHIKAMGLHLAEGAWSRAEQVAIHRGEIDFLDVIAFREDVYDLIRRHTPPKARAENGIPWQIMEAVCKGKYARFGMLEELKRYLSCTLRLPKYYISALKRIEYLPRKGDCVARWMMDE